MAESVYCRTLRKAAELIGGQAKLCRHLRVPADELQKWLEDRAAPPIGVFLRAVDLILEETPAPGGASEPPESPAPRDCAPAEGTSSRY